MVELLVESLGELNEDVQEVLLRNIVVSGGVSNTKGLVERLRKELRENLPQKMLFGLKHEPDINFYMNKMLNLAQSVYFADLVISRKMYEEYGSYALCQTLN